MNAKFILSKKVLNEQVKKLEDLGLKISYSYKTNRIVGQILQDSNVDFSIHEKDEIEEIKNKSKIWFFLQAESEKEILEIIGKGVKNFVVDNEVDLEIILDLVEKNNFKINLSLRMKFQEHRIGTGKYFVYGMASDKVNEIISKIKENKFIEKIGIHIHRKSQNTSEWEIVEDLKDSLTKKSLERINFVNLGGGLPSFYANSNVDVFNYIFSKLKETKKWLDEKGIETFIEPGRFLAAPCVKLIVEIIQKYDNNLIVNTTLYNCALDTLLTETKMLIENELSENETGKYFLIKGNSPTRDDIFRYKVKLNSNIKVGDKIIFLNAGAYNYTTDFFGYKKLETDIVEDF
ncbi:decarboxylase [Candidatus Pacearchaeota archaeon]|jgi:ornithine decarboxylase|nr:decarboxylase [Candidatus Pacearchaeota archaeon]